MREPKDTKTFLGEKKGPLPLGHFDAQDPNQHIAVICARRGVDMSKIGRNDPCPCDSGKKFKKCCLGEQPVELCYRFSKADYLFTCANAEGAFDEARKQAEEHNNLLGVLKILDPDTFGRFEELKVLKL